MRACFAGVVRNRSFHVSGDLHALNPGGRAAGPRAAMSAKQMSPERGPTVCRLPSYSGAAKRGSVTKPWSVNIAAAGRVVIDVAQLEWDTP